MKDSDLKPLLEKTLEDYAKSVGTGFEGSLRDVLTELKHIADNHDVDFQDRVDAALAVAKEEDTDGSKEFEVELYELHASRVTVHAKNKAEAILKAVHGRGEPVDDSSEYVEMADGYGMTANDAVLGLTVEELNHITSDLGIKRLDIIPTLRMIEEVG